uniref:NADH-plastoquinone oxidoreductase subunit 6 n=1 Tax=Commiphora gileadensis TaxID=1700993 RepID=A0A410PAA9_9ROSI|nr:NADH-plastoquinone oxidoreductase subunit 6 [Commiphora gileadensis]QAT19753.1 NADH-plastoquinone oxidoreductase subunit 6 [Commiphora gileadensis]
MFAWTNTRFSFSFSGIGSYNRRSGSGITYQPNLFCLFIGIGSCLYILILYSIKFPFCSCCTASYLRGSCKCFNHICCNVHEWFRLLQRFSVSSLDYWGWGYFPSLYKYFFFRKSLLFKIRRGMVLFGLHDLTRLKNKIRQVIVNKLEFIYQQTFFLPFELISIILLVALIGAIAVARQ